MDRPRVIIHNLISLDGRLDSFPTDAGLYYEMASRLPHQAVLTGSGTMLAAAAGQGIAEVVTGRHHERTKAGSVLATLGARGKRAPVS